MNLEKYISELLYQHECVIVPGFGGFITNYEPASIQVATHTILPPRKYLVFNSSLTINDGLLATSISAKKQCSFDEAMQFIHREVTAWHERLKAGKQITLPGMGSFVSNIHDKLEFRPDPDQNFFDDAYGMTPMVIPPLQKNRRKRKIKPAVYRKPVRKTSSRTIRRLAWAAAITIPLVAASIWSIMNYDSLRQYASQHSGFISVFRSEPETAFSSYNYTAPESPADNPYSRDVESAEPEILSDNGNEEPVLHSEPDKENLTIAEATPTANENPEPAPLPERAYHIIIGSFENTINAQQLVDKLNTSGWNARIAESSKGMHRVSIASYINKQEAIAALNKIREERNPNAWLLRF